MAWVKIGVAPSSCCSFRAVGRLLLRSEEWKSLELSWRADCVHMCVFIRGSQRKRIGVVQDLPKRSHPITTRTFNGTIEAPSPEHFCRSVGEISARFVESDRKIHRNFASEKFIIKLSFQCKRFNKKGNHRANKKKDLFAIVNRKWFFVFYLHRKNTETCSGKSIIRLLSFMSYRYRHVLTRTHLPTL